MPKTVTPPVSNADRPFEVARANSDGTVTLYYAGETPPPMPESGPSIPQSLTKRQLYRALMQVNWLGTTMTQIDATINAMLDAMPNPPREVARVEFFTSRDYLRNHPLLNAMVTSPQLSKTQADLDALFTLGATFQPE